MMKLSYCKNALRRYQQVGDEADLYKVNDTERQLLYVACARDHLLVTSVEPASEFIDDMRGK